MAQPRLTTTITDGKGEPATFGLWVETLDDADFTAGARYESIGDNLLQDLEPIIDGHIVEAGFNIPVGLDFTAQAAAANSDVEEKCEMTFISDNGFITRILIPTFKETLYIAGSKLVNLASQVVIDFIMTVLQGADAIPGVGEDRFDFTTNRGEDLHALIGAEEAFAGRRRRRTPTAGLVE